MPQTTHITFDEIYELCPELGAEYDFLDLDISANRFLDVTDNPLEDLFRIICDIDYLPWTFKNILNYFIWRYFSFLGHH